MPRALSLVCTTINIAIATNINDRKIPANIVIHPAITLAYNNIGMPYPMIKQTVKDIASPTNRLDQIVRRCKG